MNLNDPGFHEQFLADMKALQLQSPIDLCLTPVDLLVLIAQIHLALRHPANRGSSAQVAARLADAMTGKLGATPALVAGLRAGADPRYDTPSPAARGEAVVRPTVVCLCGSTRFRAAYEKAMRDETLCGRIVLSVGLLGHEEGLDMAGPIKASLDELHLRKIDMADEVLVLDAPADVCDSCGRPCTVTQRDNSACCAAPWSRRPYFGDSTRREIAYAEKMGRRIRYLSQEGPLDAPR